MIQIQNGRDIYYTVGDDFELFVTPDAEPGSAAQLRLQIIKDGSDEPLVNESFTYDSESGRFIIRLSGEAKTALPIGSYMYRLTLIDGTTSTTTSGAFIVQWGVC